jgi:hypothetical protein
LIVSVAHRLVPRATALWSIAKARERNSRWKWEMPEKPACSAMLVTRSSLLRTPQSRAKLGSYDALAVENGLERGVKRRIRNRLEVEIEHLAAPALAPLTNGGHVAQPSDLSPSKWRNPFAMCNALALVGLRIRVGRFPSSNSYNLASRNKIVPEPPVVGRLRTNHRPSVRIRPRSFFVCSGDVD